MTEMFNSALDLMCAQIERKIADIDILGQIDISVLNANQYSRYIDFLTERFCADGLYELFDPVLLRTLIKIFKERVE